VVEERYSNVLADYRHLLCTAFERWNGHQVDTQGDAFFIAFTRATDAVSVAIAMQRALADHPWPEGVMLRIRIGLHTDEPQRTSEGYVGLAVDLFAGSNRAVCLARFFSGTLLNSLDHGGIHDLKAALDHLQQRPEVDPERVGAIGFCMGGSFAIGWACTDDRLKAIAPYYAQNPRPLEAVERLCPVVGSYPAWDFTARDARRLDRVLDGYGVDHDIKVYPRARHSFFDENGWAYNAAASEDSWKRVLGFFAEHL